MADKNTIIDIVELIKGAGMDVVLNIELDGGPLEETFSLSESINIIPGGLGIFTAGSSVAGGFDVT